MVSHTKRCKHPITIKVKVETNRPIALVTNLINAHSDKTVYGIDWVTHILVVFIHGLVIDLRREPSTPDRKHRRLDSKIRSCYCKQNCGVMCMRVPLAVE